MKTFFSILTLALALVVVAGPAVAASRHMTGDVSAVNADAKTFTLSEHKMLRGQKQQTFRVSDPSLLSNVRTGERVKVTYDKQGQELIARAVEPVTTASKTK
jgi:Cu/Ag efflux protein CusF